jgi:hypothetical protein
MMPFPLKFYFISALFGFLSQISRGVLMAHAATITISPYLPGSGFGPSVAPGGYIRAFYLFSLMIGGMLAFGAIVYGGIKRVTSGGNPSGVSEANQWIQSALLGLLLLIAAYLILFTINPNLVNLSLPSLGSMAGGTTGASSGTLLPAGGTSAGGGSSGAVGGIGGTGLTQAAAQADLAAAGIAVVSSGNCSDPNNPSCTSLQGMRQDTINTLVDLKNNCGPGCSVIVTGGTETGHAAGDESHGTGYKADVAVNPAVTNYIEQTSGFTPIGNRSSDGAPQWKAPDGTIYALEASKGHWDITAL